jgi:outer membrane protein OmpA-like peptidoglycan-associated protein
MENKVLQPFLPSIFKLGTATFALLFQKKCFYHMKNFWLIASLFVAFKATAQEKMEVTRCAAVDRSAPVWNVYVDANNVKWVSNRLGLFQVLSSDQSVQVKLKPGDWSLLTIPDGNFDLRLQEDELYSQMDGLGPQIRSGEVEITAGIYDERKQELWLGTNGEGVFHLKTAPQVRLVQHFQGGNSKLVSEDINTMHLDARGNIWIGTTEGAMYGSPGNWRFAEKTFSIQSFTPKGNEIWVMGEGQLWRVDEKYNWKPVEIEERLIEGQVRDITFDLDGWLWVASDIASRYNPETDASEIFGPAIGFTSQDVENVITDLENAVWVGTNDKGLYLIQKASSITVAVSVEKDLPCNETRPVAALKVTVGGGKAPYKYAWQPAGSGDQPQNLGPGEYTVTVTDADGKTKTAKAVIHNPNLTLSLSQEKIESGPGAADGAASVKVTGGKPDYTYRWDNGETTAKAVKLTSGSHSLTVTDRTGCSATGTVFIEQKIAGLNVSITQTADIQCFGGKDAALKASVSGGKAPFSLKWSDGKTGEQAGGLAAGNFSVTVTDAAGQSANAAFSIKEPKALTATAQAQSPASTGNADGKANASASGGSGKYTYKWDNGETAATASKLAPGNHTVTVTDEAGCTATATVSITENILALNVSITQTADISCFGGKDAALKASVSGGKAPFSLKWSDGKTGEQAGGLAAGNFSVTVTDAAGQSANAAFSIKEPKALTATAQAQSPASTGNADGKANASASGGSGKYTYKWDNGETAATASKLAPGNHTVTVTDEAGCTATATVSITENILALNVSITQTADISCFGGKDAALKASVSGGKAPFSLKWSDGKTGEQAGGLAAGNFSVTVTDAAGQSANAAFSIKEPKALTATAQAQSPASTGNADGKANASANGGSGKYTYKWDNGETAATASKLAPGNHTVTVTDEAGCTATATVSITENILALNVSITQTADIPCFGGKDAALKASVSGGKAPFSLKWSDGKTGEQASGLAAGNFSVTATDVTGQAATATFQVKEPNELKASVVKNRPAVSERTKDGKAEIRATGGSGAYAYKWDNEVTTAANGQLAPGAHSVTVSDEKGCSVTLTFETGARILPDLATNKLQSGEAVRLDKLLFASDSSAIEPSSVPTLNELFDFLEDNPSIKIEVGGHTNNVPPHEYCDRLSTARAKSVADYLIDKGITAARISFKGYGKRNPVATNATPEGRLKNQRVEIKIIQ